MNVKDILDIVKVGKSTAKSHMRNLIEIAAADGVLGAEEQRLLQYAAQRNNISPAELEQIQSNTSSIPFQVPASAKEKFFQLYDLVHMMVVDKNIHDEEFRLCEIFAVRFGYRQQIVRQVIDLIRQNIEQWIGPRETMDTVSQKFKVFD